MKIRFSKLINPVIAVVCIVITLFSCTEDTQKDKEKESENLSNAKKMGAAIEEEDCIYYVSEDESNEMIAKFISDYKFSGSPRREVKGLSTETWIDKCVFISIDSFLQSNKSSFDGVRFYNLDTNPSTLGIIVTSPVPSPSSTYKHTDRPDTRIPDLCRTPSSLLNIAEDNFKYRSDSFCFQFRKEKTFGSRKRASLDSLSASVWMSSCVIHKLVEKLKTDSLRLDGMMAFSAAYVKVDGNRSTRIGQNYINQSTLVFIPTKPNGENHKPDYTIFNEESKKRRLGSANHGQLCPQICN